MSGRKEQCKTCRFWEVRPGESVPVTEDTEGACHRFPPALNVDALCRTVGPLPVDNSIESVEAGHRMAYWVFPHTSAVMWCGEWQPMPEDT